MKRPFFTSLLVTTSLVFLSCDQPQEDNSAIKEQTRQLEARAQLEKEQQKQKKQEAAAQRLAQEWEAIERERKALQEKWTTLESQDKLADELAALKLRNEELANRESKAEEEQSELVINRSGFSTSGKRLLSESEFRLAGLDAGEFADSGEDHGEAVNYDYFNEALSPYGTWYETSEYGSVWQPAVCRDPDWRPYCRGQWVCTDRGWTWVSTEPFGWATYHYGRWARLQSYGWIWVPGTEWAPNWCTWRSNNDYIGWAPLPPETLAYQGIGWDTHAEGRFGIPSTCFTFVRTLHFDRVVSRYCLPVRHNSSCLNITTNITRIRIVNNQVFCGGPGYQELTERLGRRPPYYRIERHQKPSTRPKPDQLRSQVRGDRLIVAAPRVRSSRTTKPATRLDKPVVERSRTLDPKVIAAYRQSRQQESGKPSADRNPTTKPMPRPSSPPPLPPKSWAACHPHQTPRPTRDLSYPEPCPNDKARSRSSSHRRTTEAHKAILGNDEETHS